MVKLDKNNNKRVCSCGRIIKCSNSTICSNCIISYNKLRQKLGSEINITINNFIQHIKKECGYTENKGNNYE